MTKLKAEHLYIHDLNYILPILNYRKAVFLCEFYLRELP
jgi:hypothetical protein